MFGRTKKVAKVDAGGLSLERLRDRWIGKINGYIDAVISRQNPTEPFEVRLSRAFDSPLTQDELSWLYREVRGSICGRVAYSLSPGNIEQRIKATGRGVVELTIVVTPEPNHPVKIFY